MSEFCAYCGAGIGEHRRGSEGTCPKCDPNGGPAKWNVLLDKCPIKRRLLPEPTCPECGSTVLCFYLPNSNSTFCLNEWHDEKGETLMAVEMTSDAYFCCRCGTELHTRATETFDGRTGLRMRERFCPNVGKCIYACMDGLPRHQMNFWGSKCKTCGCSFKGW